MKSARFPLLKYGIMLAVTSSFAQVTLPSNAEQATVRANRQAATHLPLDEGIKEKEAHRGFISTLPDSAIRAAKAGPYAMPSASMGSSIRLTRPIRSIQHCAIMPGSTLPTDFSR
jgi:hypothetical protein